MRMGMEVCASSSPFAAGISAATLLRQMHAASLLLLCLRGCTMLLHSLVISRLAAGSATFATNTTALQARKQSDKLDARYSSAINANMSSTCGPPNASAATAHLLQAQGSPFDSKCRDVAGRVVQPLHHLVTQPVEVVAEDWRAPAALLHVCKQVGDCHVTMVFVWIVEALDVARRLVHHAC